VLVRSLLFLMKDQPRQSKGGNGGATGQSEHGAEVLYTEVAWMSRQTAAVITLNSKGKFIVYKDPAALL